MIRFLLFALILLCTTPALAGDQSFTLKYDGLSRDVIIHMPPNSLSGNPAGPLPTVIGLHGGGGDAQEFINQYNLNPYAERAGMMMVYPEGSQGMAGKFLTWNAGACCGKAAKNNVDDVGYLSALIDELVKNHNADPKRIYVTGHSNGSMMAYRLACEAPGKIAAIAPVSGQSLVENCTHPVPVLHIHGTADKCALYNGGPACGGCFSNVLGTLFGRSDDKPADQRNDVWPCKPVESSVASIAHGYGCSDETQIVLQNGPMTCRTWKNCPAHGDVTLCSIAGGGHAWPGLGPPGFCQRRPNGQLCTKWNEEVGPVADIDINALIFNFFAKH